MSLMCQSYVKIAFFIMCYTVPLPKQVADFTAYLLMRAEKVQKLKE